MKVYAYLRVSTRSQVEHGAGLDIQLDEIEKHTHNCGLDIADIFIDEGISGTTIERPALAAMLASLEVNKDVDAVIVLNVSRLWRSDIAGGLIRYNLTKLNRDIISIQEPSYTLYENDPSNFLISSIMQALAQYDRMLINQKLAAGRSVKASKGKKACGTASLGYRWENKEIKVDFEHEKIVYEMFKKFSECQSFEKVARYCDLMGYRTKSGKSFSRQAVAAIIRNDFYAGIVTHDGRKSVGTHPLFIEKSLWISCNPHYEHMELLQEVA